jgi:hypothetical protein
MGSMIYEVAPAIQIKDRALRHLQNVIISRLRQHESFCFAWNGEPDVGGDESDEATGNGDYGAIWISPHSSLYFTYSGPQEEPLNTAWLELLTRSVAGRGTLRMLSEPT